MLIGYKDNKTLVLQARGSGGINEMAQNLTAESCNFAYLRVINKDDETTRTKFVFISWKGDNAPVMRKGNMSVHISSVKSIIKVRPTSLCSSLTPSRISASKSLLPTPKT